MSTWTSIAVAVTFVWLGMVLAISFLEAPLKFRVPGVTLPLGLAIGRRVFRALNSCELVLGTVLVVSVLVEGPGTTVAVAAVVCAVLLLAQLAAVRPALARRSDQVLAGDTDGPRSHAHLWYVGLEVLKVAALVTGGVALLGS